jgi:NADH-quinone oxidoreductase subunit M
MSGFAATMPLIAAFFTLGGLSSLGMPGTAGFVAEFLVFLGAFESGHPWWGVAGAIGAFITAIYVLRAVKTIFWGEGPPEEYKNLPDAMGYEVISLWILGLTILVLGVWPRLVLDLIDGTTPTMLAQIAQDIATGAGQ